MDLDLLFLSQGKLNTSDHDKISSSFLYWMESFLWRHKITFTFLVWLALPGCVIVVRTIMTVISW